MNIKSIDGKDGVWIRDDFGDIELMVTGNGYQWTGIPINEKRARMIIDGLQSYFNELMKQDIQNRILNKEVNDG